MDFDECFIINGKGFIFKFNGERIIKFMSFMLFGI